MTSPTTFDTAVAALEHQWATDSRWKGVRRPYTAADVIRLRGSVERDSMERQVDRILEAWRTLGVDDFGFEGPGSLETLQYRYDIPRGRSDRRQGPDQFFHARALLQHDILGFFFFGRHRGLWCNGRLAR